MSPGRSLCLALASSVPQVFGPHTTAPSVHVNTGEKADVSHPCPLLPSPSSRTLPVGDGPSLHVEPAVPSQTKLWKLWRGSGGATHLVAKTPNPCRWCAWLTVTLTTAGAARAAASAMKCGPRAADGAGRAGADGSAASRRLDGDLHGIAGRTAECQRGGVAAHGSNVHGRDCQGCRWHYNSPEVIKSGSNRKRAPRLPTSLGWTQRPRLLQPRSPRAPPGSSAGSLPRRNYPSRLGCRACLLPGAARKRCRLRTRWCLFREGSP